MDKNYSVDDILLDIKSKKKRRKEQGGDTPPVLGAPQDKFPGTTGGGKNGLEFAPDPAADVLRELRARPAAPPPPAPPPPAAQPPKAAPAPPQPIIEPLGDIGGEQPTAAFKPVRAPESIEDLKRLDNRFARSNPMNFDGHVRPLTDRAKIRKNKNTRADTAPEDTAVIDFVKFGVQAEDADDNLQETQVMPSLGPSRELDLEEIRNMDFSAPDDTHYDNSYDYDEDEDEEDAAPHRPAVDFSEYNSVEDRRDVALDIARVKLWLVIRTFLTFALGAALIYLILCGRFMLPMPEMLAPEVDLNMYLMAIAALTIAVAVVNSSAMGGGLISFFKMRSNSDSLVALAMLAAVGQCVFAITHPELINPYTLTFYSALACTSMFWGALGKLRMISRIQANFKIISSDKPKRAVMIATDENFTREYLKGATRKPSIAYAADCEFFTDFLALSYSDKYDVGINKAVAPVCLVGAGVVGVLTYMLTQGNTVTAISAVVGILCVAATFSATFVENVPLSKLTRKLAPRGGMVSGNKAVEDFCDVSAVVLRECDLFPPGHLEVHGIKAYSRGRVDEAILDAASIAYAMNSALSGVFLQMIGGNKKLLRKVDNEVFEDGKGITAWIDGRKVMLGNRHLMQAHGILLPEPGYEKKYADMGGEPLFLTSGGELTAQLVVGYKVDEELALELDKLGAQGKTLIVHTIDPCLTAHKVWELYGYPEGLVQIMPAYLHGLYEKMSAPRASEFAEIAYTGRASAMVGSILACVSARSSILAATTVQLIQIALGYGLIALMAFLGSIDTLTILVLGGYQLFWFFVIGLIQKMKAA